MAQSKILNSKLTEPNQDLISNLPDIAIEKILKRLPMSEAARMSILSTKWRKIWLSFPHLIFNKDFWDELEFYDYEQEHVFVATSIIISNILFHHVGPVRTFDLFIPNNCTKNEINISQWLSFLSRIGVKKFILVNDSVHYITMPSHIFNCKDLEGLGLAQCRLKRVPNVFKGFACLRWLELIRVRIKLDVFMSLIAHCPRLSRLLLEQITSITDLVLDVPSLELLSIEGGVFETLVLQNVSRLSGFSLCFDKMKGDTLKAQKSVDYAIKILAASRQLDQLQFGGQTCKFLAAGWIAESQTNVAFNHLNTLSLAEIDLSDFDVFCVTFALLRSCPFIKLLEITVISNDSGVEHQKIDYNDNYKLGHLLKVEIKGITGSSAELTLINYLLSVSVVLEELCFKCKSPEPISQLMVSRKLMRLQRASPKAILVPLD